MDTYELTVKKNRYRTMKENVNKVIGVLSSNNIIDNIDMAEDSLRTYYRVNETSPKSKVLNSQKERVRNALSKLYSISNSISNKINDINDDIEKAEAEGNM